MAADAERSELEAYLGPAFDERRLIDHARAMEEELAEIGDEATLYRTSEAYLYDLTAFAMSATKAPYLEVLRRHVPPGARLLDMGCGIGSDGLALLEAGYAVTFADFDNPSTRYLRWRLERRGLGARVLDLDRDPLPSGFDLAYAFDVIEHVDDPVAFLERLESVAAAVLVNLLEPVPGDNVLHHRPLPVRRLVRRAAARELRYHRVLHGRSHLVLYGSHPARGLARLRSLAALARGRAWS